jgi:hypothetical protein
LHPCGPFAIGIDIARAKRRTSAGTRGKILTNSIGGTLTPNHERWCQPHYPVSRLRHYMPTLGP